MVRLIICYLGRAFPDSPWVPPAQHWPLGLMVVPGWPGTRFEASHFPAVEPELLPLWSSLQSSPQPAWFSGTLWQASDKSPFPGRTLEQRAVYSPGPTLRLACVLEEKLEPTAEGAKWLTLPLTGSKYPLQHPIWNTSAFWRFLIKRRYSLRP